MSLRAIAVWLAIVPIAIANGAVRERLIVPAAGPAAGHVISTLMLCAAILLVTWLTIGWMRPASLRDAARIGIGWLALTMAFEFLAGHYVFGTSWDRLLADYNLADGRVWILIPIMTAIAPWLVARARITSSRAPVPTYMP
jgi:hypothetical protein